MPDVTADGGGEGLGALQPGQAGTGMTGWNLAAPGEHPRTGSCCRQRKKEGERPVPEKERDLGTQCTRQALLFPRSGLTEKWGRVLHRVQTPAPVSDPHRATHGSGTALRPHEAGAQVPPATVGSGEPRKTLGHRKSHTGSGSIGYLAPGFLYPQ